MCAGYFLKNTDAIITLGWDLHLSAYMEQELEDKNSLPNIAIKPKDSKIYHGPNRDFF